MNRYIQNGAFVIFSVLFIVLLCCYLDITSSITTSRVSGVNENFTSTRELVPSRSPESILNERSQKPATLNKKDVATQMKDLPDELPQPIIDRIKTLVFFLGHGRSGHSIVASLMDSHPHMVISHEYNLFMMISRGLVAPTKSEIFNALWNNTRRAIIKGKRSKSKTRKGYTLFIDGLYQGRYLDHIDVIGDKKGYGTTDMLRRSPDKWSRVYNILKSLGVSVKVIHVIRNPYDNIATGALYSLSFKGRSIGAVKKTNKTFEVDADTIKEKIDMYFSFHKTIMDAELAYHLDIIEIHGNDLISDPKGTLLKMCNDLGVACPDDYLKICSDKIFKSESKTRYMIRWTKKQLNTIQENIEKYNNLKRYNFHS